MRMFKLFFLEDGRKTFWLYLILISVVYLVTNINPESEKVIQKFGMNLNTIIMLFGILSGLIIGVIEPYIPSLLSIKGEWYKTLHLPYYEIPLYFLTYSIIFSSVPAITLILKGFSLTYTFQYFLTFSVLISFTTATIKSLIASIFNKLNTNSSVILILFIVAIITFAGDISEAIVSDPPIYSLISVSICVIGNYILIKEVHIH